MEQYVTRIGDVTIQRVIPSGGGPPEPVRVMDGEELLRAVKEEPIDEDEEEAEEETPMEGEEGVPSEGAPTDMVEGKEDQEQDPEEEEGEGDGEGEVEGEGDGEGEVEGEGDGEVEGDGDEEEEDEEEEKIIIKAEPQDQDELLGEGVETEEPMGEGNEEDEEIGEDKEPDGTEEKPKEQEDPEEEKDSESGECSKRKADNETEDDDESSSKKKKVEIDVDLDKKKISNLRRNIREVMDETQLDEATLAAQRQEAERLRRVQDQQKYIREVQRQIQLNRQNSKTQSRVISLLQGGSTSILKSSSVGGTTTATSTGPSTVLVKVGSGQQQVLNRKTLEVLRGGKSVSSSTEPMRSGLARVTTTNKPAMVTPSVSIAPVKPVILGDAQKKVPVNDADVVTISSSSDSENDCIVISEGEEDEEEEEEEDDDPTNSGMHTNDLYNIPDDQGQVLINVGKPEEEREIFLAPQISRIIKPHQIGGVRFLFDNVVESLDRFDNSTGFGCILAHSMGLGKTLQVVSFCDVFLRETAARTVMCIMPINTLQNWMAEFNMWLPSDPATSPLSVHGEVRPRNFGIYVLNDLNKTITSRAKVVEEWSREGGVLLIGYEMYRQLSLKRASRVRKGKKKQQMEEEVEDEKHKPLLEAMHEALVKPGPDLVICDEGHRIKNSHASISHALKQIRTKRRVVLTGYPLQNNLLEYWCMVDFVRPNYLGTKTEFSNMFERPIQNGQCIDSTPQDIRLMRYRAHVLHSLLEGFVQRRSHSVLRHSLPQKEEYVLLVKMTTLQRKLYDTFMNEVVRTKAVPNPLKAFAVCCKIWNHPDILYNFLKKKELDELQDLELEETAGLQQQTGPNSPRRPLAKEKRGKKEVKKAQVAPIKAEVTSQPQSQPATPDLKLEDRKFDFPNGGQGGGPPPSGYDYYPPPHYPADVPYQYHRPPYYPGGYYQEGPAAPPPPSFYQQPPPPQHGYDQGTYPGYYPGYDQPQPPYPKGGEEFGKQPWTNQPFTSPTNIKQEKNQSKSPKEHESPPKPGFQEFYPKEEKPDVKEEKQTFLCGFSGGQVSYNYRNFPGGYPNYPYPSNEYPGWNKGGYPPFPQGDPSMPGGQASGSSPQDRQPPGGGASGNPGGQPGMFPSQNHPEGQNRPLPNQERSHNLQPSQGPQHGGSERSQRNQNVSPETHPGTMTKENQHRSHTGQERPHSSQETSHGNYINLPINQKGNDHLRKQSSELMPSNNQTLYGNKKHEGNSESNQRNQDTPMKGRNMQDNDSKHFQNVNNPSNQHNLFNPHEGMRNQHQLYGNRNQHEDFRMPFGSPDRHIAGPQNPHEQSTTHSSQSNKNNQQQQFSGQQVPTDNQQRMQGSTEQNMAHGQNPYNNQRNDHNARGGSEQMQNPQNISIQTEHERMVGIHQGLFGNQDSQSSHEHSNRQYNATEHFSSNQKNIYGNKRNEHNLPVNQEHVMATQQMHDPPRRPSLGQENIHSQASIFNNQRNDSITHSFQEHSQINQQHSPVTLDKQESRNRHHASQGSQQMFLNPRNENEAQIPSNTKHSGQPNMRVPDMGMHPSQERVPPNQQNLGMAQGSSHMYGANQETLQGNQHQMFRAQSQHDGQHRSHGNFYGNQFDHSLNSGQDQGQQTSLNNQNVQQNQKRISSNTDHSSGLQQNPFSQSDHSVQKMIRNEPHLDSHQMMHSNQERPPPSQYSMYPPDNLFLNQHAHQGTHESNLQNPNEKQNVQESQNNPHLNRERMQSSQGVGPNQERQSNPQTMFNNPNTPDLRWHGNSERPLNQQNMYEQSQHSKDDNTQSIREKHPFHGNQDYPLHNQQNVYGQSGQDFHRTSELHGKHQGMVTHENQYRMGKERSHMERNPGMMSGVENKSSNQETRHGPPQNRQNTQDNNMHNPQENIQNLQSSQNIHGSQHLQRSMPHSNQDQIHSMMGGNKPVSQGHSDHSHSGVNAQGISNQDGSQCMPSYNLQSSPQQTHQNPQHNIHGNQPMSNQNVNRSQHGSVNTQEQPGNSHPFSDSQHTMYNSQYHMQGDQHSLNNPNIHGNQLIKNPHHTQTQTGQNMQMYGNQMSQGNTIGQGMSLPMQNQGMHSQNPNHGQSSHGPISGNQVQHGMSPLNQGQHGSTPMNQGQHGPAQMSQGQHGSASMNQGQHGSASMNQGQHGSASMNQGQHGSASMNQGQHGSASMNQGQHGATPMNQGQHGAAQMNQGQHGAAQMNQGQQHGSMSQGQHGSTPMNQGQHGSTPMNQGPHGSGSINQGQHSSMNQGQPGNQYTMHMNQSVPNSNQYQTGNPPLHGSKDQNNQSSNVQGSFQSSHQSGPYVAEQQSNLHNIHLDQMQMNQNTSKMSNTQHGMHNKTQTTPTKNDFQKIQTSPMSQTPPHQQSQSISQQGTQTGIDNSGQTSGPQHRVQNMLAFQPGQSHNMSYEQNIISNKSMSGGQVLQGAQQQKHSMQNVLGKNDEQNRFRSNFSEPLPSNNESYQGNFQKPGFYGQDFQFPYQGQFPYQDKQFPDHPGTSGQMIRKDDEKQSDENRLKDAEVKSQHDSDDIIKTNTTSTSTETDDERKDKREEDEKSEKKLEGKIDSTTPQKSGKEDPGIPYDWATEILKGYTPGDIGSSGKMAIFFCILEESIALGDRILVFSQSLFTLNLMEELLQQQFVPGREEERWAKNVNYYRLDGSTTAMEREKLINEFNSNANLHLFLVSTRAGSLGINLVGANRVIVFDASWNPCHDTQAVCRVYRYGQKKPCFVYRLVTDNCLEKKIYDRQINKQGMSDRVVDECNPDAHLSIKEVTSLCWDDKEDDVDPKDFTSLQDQYIDVVLQKVIQKHSSELSKEPFAHESLLVDRKEKKLSQAEKRLAKRSYELEKQASTRPMYNGINQNQSRPKPMASVRPMQAEMGQAGRQRGWIPASVWQRQGMSAQEMTLPLDVVIPTNAADRASIVLKAGQKVMVLKSPKGIYMQLENGKIIAIRTAFKVGGKKPGEQGKVGPADITPRRGMRQIGAPRGRPIRAVGPVTRPPPVTLTVTKKRLSEDEQAGRKEDESDSSSENAQSTPMEVSESPSMEKEGSSESDTPNPFTAAAAASLSSMQVSPSGDEHGSSVSPDHSPEKQQSSPNPIQSHTPPQQHKPPTPVPVQPQVTMSPQPQPQTQPQASVQPLPSKPGTAHPQVSVQPMVQSPQTPHGAHSIHQVTSQKLSSVQSHLSGPQQSIQVPMETQTSSSIQNRSPMHIQLPVQTQHSVQAQHVQPVQPQQPYTNQPQIPVQPQSMAAHPHSQSSSSVQPHSQVSSLQAHSQSSVSMQTQGSTPMMTQSQVSGSMQTHSHGTASVQVHNQTSNSMQTHTGTQASASIQTLPQPHPSSSIQSHSQTSSSMQTHPQVPTSMQQQPPISLHPHYPIPSHSQGGFPMAQSPHHSPYPMQGSQQKQGHFPSLSPHQFPLAPQQGQYPMAPQQSQFLGHQSFPMHPQPQYPVHPQQAYPVQPQPQYPLPSHNQFGGQPPHQFPLHPQPQFPIQSPSQFDPPPTVPSSMMTDHLS